jgi:hypothetical protein
MNTNPIKTIRNNGQKDGMTNQCLFISILDFIIRNINNTLTLKHLRDVGGLDTSSEHTMCDTINNIYINAINEICDVFELVIIVLPIDYNGNILYNGTIIDTFGKGYHIVRIAQFGLNHFELISDEGNNYRPMVTIKNEIIESSYLRSLSDELEELYNKDAQRKTLQVLLLNLKENVKSCNLQVLDLYYFDDVFEQNLGDETQENILLVNVSEVEEEITKLIEYIQRKSAELLENKTQYKLLSETNLSELQNIELQNDDIDMLEVQIISLKELISKLDNEIKYLGYLMN